MKTWVTSLMIKIWRARLILVFQVALIFAASVCHSQDSSAEASPRDEKVVSLGAEADMNSQYIWRGIVFEDNTVMQPSLWASVGDFTVSIWNNHILSRKGGLGIGDEVDFTLAHEHDWRLLTTGLEFAFYLYPGEDESPRTGELSFSLSRSVGLLNVSTQHIFDVIEYKNAYFGEASLSVEHEPTRGLNLEMKALVGWASAEFNQAYAGISHSALNLAGAELAATIHIAGPFYVRPHAETYFILDRMIANATAARSTNAGLAFGVE